MEKTTIANPIIGFGIFIILIIFFIAFSLTMFFVIEATNNLSYIAGDTISSVDKLEMHLKGKMLTMKKEVFSDSDSVNYKQAEKMVAELEAVRDKLIEIKIRFFLIP